MRARSTRSVIGTGLILCSLGILALFYTATATLTSVILLGVFLFMAGISEIVYGIVERKSRQLWPHLTVGVLAVACSILIGRNPIENTLGLTLVVGFYLLGGGMIKVLSSLIEKYVGWGYMLANGCISIGLGALVLANFPLSAIWTIGTIVGIDLLVAGSTLVSLGIHYRKRPTIVSHQKPTESKKYDDIFPPPP